jgi:hypothetical protein
MIISIRTISVLLTANNLRQKEDDEERVTSDQVITSVAAILSQTLSSALNVDKEIVRRLFTSSTLSLSSAFEKLSKRPAQAPHCSQFRLTLCTALVFPKKVRLKMKK